MITFKCSYIQLPVSFALLFALIGSCNAEQIIWLMTYNTCYTEATLSCRSNELYLQWEGATWVLTEKHEVYSHEARAFTAGLEGQTLLIRANS